MLTATLYLGNHDKNNIKIESSQWDNRNHLFLTSPLCQFLCVGQGMEQTWLYLWYHFFQAQWDGCDQQIHGTSNYLVKIHHLSSVT
jgi:hypothetical protein